MRCRQRTVRKNQKRWRREPAVEQHHHGGAVWGYVPVSRGESATGSRSKSNKISRKMGVQSMTEDSVGVR